MSKTTKCKKCVDCNIVLNNKNCRRINIKRSTYRSYDNRCIKCRSKATKIYNHNYINTIGGFFRLLLANAKINANIKKNRGRTNAGTCDLTLEQIFDIYNKQNGKCWYSGITMNTITCSDWKASLERIDNNLGYTYDNVVLVCHEFNNQTKWSHEKIHELIIEIIKEHDYPDIVKDIEGSLNPRKINTSWKKTNYKIIKGIKYAECRECLKFKTMDNYDQRNRTCKKCCYYKKKKYKETIRGHLISLLWNSKNNTKIKLLRSSRQKSGKVEDECTITFEDLVNTLKNQRGLCYYSGIKLNYGSYLDKNWVASLERINPLKGYTKENICLICNEFNTADYTARYKYNSNGSGSWSNRKFIYFIEQLLKPKYPISVNYQKYLEDKSEFVIEESESESE